MTQCLQTLLVGFIFGLACGFLSLPIPAPPTLAGIMGIVGVFIGYVIMRRFT